MDQISQQFKVLQRPISKIAFKYDITKSESANRNKNNESSLKLPNIYFKANNQIKQIILIQDKLKLITAISKGLNFQNKKVSCISGQILNKINQETKPVPYNSNIYQDQLNTLNKIFQSIGFHFKTKDVLILIGKRTQTTYTFFTNYPQHPLTICCKCQIIIKHMHFLSPMYQKSLHKLQTLNNKPLKNLIIISCLQCGKSIIKIKVENKQQQFQHPLSEFQEKKKLIHYSKLIASGKFKKNLILEDNQAIFDRKSRSKSILNNNQNSYIVNKPVQQKTIQDQSAALKVKRQQMSLDLIKNRNKNRLTYRLNLNPKISESQRYKQSTTFSQM